MLKMLVMAIPALLVYTAGLGIAVSTWHKHAQVSMLASLGFGLLIVSRMINIGLYVSFVQQQFDAFVFQLVNTGNALLSVLAIALLTAAIFGWRNSRNDEPY